MATARITGGEPRGDRTWSTILSSTLARPRRRLATTTAMVVCLAVSGVVDAAPAPGSAAESTTALTLHRTIQTSPFDGSRVSMVDSEASAYVPRDHAVWLADDNGRRLYVVDVRTGRLKRSIGRTALESVHRLGGGRQAGTNRTKDLESLAYDGRRDRLYLFSGSCCKATVRPTAFRLTRRSGRLRPESWQPLRRGTDNTAAAWNPGNETMYVGNESTLRRYSYRRNRTGPAIKVPNLTGILGMDFDGDGTRLVVARWEQRLSMVDWSDKALRWTAKVSPLGVRDPRAVEFVRGRLWVADGYDGRRRSNPLDHAVFVLELR